MWLAAGIGWRHSGKIFGYVLLFISDWLWKLGWNSERKAQLTMLSKEDIDNPGIFCLNKEILHSNEQKWYVKDFFPLTCLLGNSTHLFLKTKHFPSGKKKKKHWKSAWGYIHRPHASSEIFKNEIKMLLGWKQENM